MYDWKWFRRASKREGDKFTYSDKMSKLEGAGILREGVWDVRDLTTESRQYLLADETVSR